MLKKFNLIAIFVFAFCDPLLATTVPNVNFVKTKEFSEFSTFMSKKHAISKKDLEQIFTGIKPQQHVIDKMTKPFERLPWFKYRDRVLSEKRIFDGAKFYAKHKDFLRQVEQQYNVPSLIIVSILGLETNYGGFQGNISVLESLTTLAFYYPKRSHFFKSELIEFLLLCKEMNWDPKEVKGSYAGALGMAQFMPSNYRKLAIGNSENNVDLFKNEEHAILSIANYLSYHGWVKDIPVAIKIPDEHEANIKNNPKISPHNLHTIGVKVPEVYDYMSKRLDIIEFEGSKSPNFQIVLDNFYVIKKYNTSNSYALSVYLLSKKIEDKISTILNNL